MTELEHVRAVVAINKGVSASRWIPLYIRSGRSCLFPTTRLFPPPSGAFVLRAQYRSRRGFRRCDCQLRERPFGHASACARTSPQVHLALRSSHLRSAFAELCPVQERGDL